MIPLTEKDKLKILRNIYRNYLTYRDYISGFQEGGTTAAEFIDFKGVSISYSDLRYGVEKLAPRKKEAFFYNVILDWSQADTAAKMGIREVTVGQYVDAAMAQLAKRYFAEDDLDTNKDTSSAVK